MRCNRNDCIWNDNDECRCTYALIIKFTANKDKIVECSAYEIEYK